MRHGLRRGLVEGSVVWILVGAAAWVVHYVTRPETPLVARENLRLGDSLIVTHLPGAEAGRRGRRRGRGQTRESSDGS